MTSSVKGSKMSTTLSITSFSFITSPPKRYRLGVCSEPIFGRARAPRTPSSSGNTRLGVQDFSYHNVARRASLDARVESPVGQHLPRWLTTGGPGNRRTLREGAVLDAELVLRVRSGLGGAESE